ncbi:MAG TPA: uracil-DNA glycosylase, partial [Pyrinomonadaceae bacterium]|nr:uracil-DNA glycosylase [Pyrinomonadaceae bacterium]
MDERSELREMLRALAEDVAESAAYLRELGADGLEGLSPDVLAGAERPDAGAQPPAREYRPAPPKPPTKTIPPALARNASADKPKSPPRALTAPPLRADGPTSALYQTAMPTKKPVRKPSPDPPEPRETLFGDITPKDELSLGTPGETFDDIRADVGECVRCPLHQGRTKIVHTEGNQRARLMFVGEAPGADEDASGRPFVGRAGQLLNKIIEAIGLKREDVLIGNINRCRPPGNRTPTTD